jgi:hypothetical protein
MSLPLYLINSMTYSGGTVSLNANYSNFLCGVSTSSNALISISGFYTGVTLSYTQSFNLNATYSFAMSVSASTTYNLTFSYLKSPYINYPIDTPHFFGITGGSSLNNGGYPYTTNIYNTGNYGTLYQVNRVVRNYIFTT